MANKAKDSAREKRRQRIRNRVRGTEQKPRLCVFRSNRYTYVQLISDESGTVLASASTKVMEQTEKSAGSAVSAKALGLKIAELAKEKNLQQIVFDRNGYVYHGRVAAVAEGAREGGLQF